MIEVFELTDAEQALGHAISADDAIAIPSAEAFVDRMGEEQALTFAEEHQVISHVAHRLNQTNNRDRYLRKWSAQHDAWSKRLTAYLSELERVATAFSEKDIIMIALKNSGIARGLHNCPGCNPMGDLDVLVSPTRFRDAHQIMVELGYEFELRSPTAPSNLDTAESSGGTEYRTRLDSGDELWFEVQWRPVAGRWIQPDQEPKADDLIARSQAIEGSSVRLLAPEDNLLQVALHTAKHSYVRAPGFRLHTDVDRIVRGQEIDWDRFVQLTNELGVRTATFFSLVIARQICATPIPDVVCQQLAPSRPKQATMIRLLRSAGLFHPSERKFTRAQYLRFTSLLYDDLGGLWRAIIPRQQTMTQRYGNRPKWQLPWLHTRRIVDLLFHRRST